MRCFRRGFSGLALLLAGWAGAVGPTARADVQVPSIFGDHMVLQQDAPVRVWGWAAPGESVRVRLRNASALTTAAADGTWRVELPPMRAAQEPAVLLIAGTTRTLACSDVLIGEVWLCSGQSNMEWNVEQAADSSRTLAAAADPQLRLFRVQKALGATPARDVQGRWLVCSAENLQLKGPGVGFSAVGYHFGRELRQALKRPVAMIDSSWGGTRIEPWTAPGAFRQVPGLEVLARQAELLTPGSAAHRAAADAALAANAAWRAEAAAALEAGTALPAPPAMPRELLSPREHTDPLAIYNAMIHPLVPYGLRGALWYQGESNHQERDYDLKMQALVGGWRAAWGLGEFPFYYVQIAPYQYGDEPNHILPEFWEQQARAEAQISNTGMAVINDIATLHDIHPPNKRDVGARLARLALRRTYGRRGVVEGGARFERLVAKPGELQVLFANTAGKLASRDGKPLTWFEVRDRDADGWTTATARIDGNAVVLTAPGAPHPVAVRFAWHKLAEPNLVNGAGLPTGAFRPGAVPVHAAGL